MVGVVQTMTCQSCRRLVDVLIGYQGKDGPSGNPDYDQDLGVCPRCSGKDVEIWSDPGACPKCDGRMIKGEETLLWD